MKYFIDTEFIEGSQPTIFGKTKPTIDLISIGIVADDNREYYAISKDFNLKEAWGRFQWKDWWSIHGEVLQQKEYWLRDNVLKPIFNDWNKYSHHAFTYKNMKYCIKMIGKSNAQIAEEVKLFTANRENNKIYSNSLEDYYIKYPPKFYGYYADYDWVVFCWLFGYMKDLPKGFPYYCNDLNQMLNEVQNSFIGKNINGIKYKDIKTLPTYPRQHNEHNALADARWNKNLYYFLQELI